MPDKQSSADSYEPNDITYISIDGVENSFVKRGVEYWRSVCGARHFPARRDLTLRGMAAILPYSLIIAVIDDGADFEYRYVGDIARQAFKGCFKGMRVSQIEATAPEFGHICRRVYEKARSTARPFAVIRRTRLESMSAGFLSHESAFLPLGESDDAVDHILIVGVQVHDAYWKLPHEKLKSLAQLTPAPIVAK